jgi:hypothetical protein
MTQSQVGCAGFEHFLSVTPIDHNALLYIWGLVSPKNDDGTESWSNVPNPEPIYWVPRNAEDKKMGRQNSGNESLWVLIVARLDSHLREIDTRPGLR